MLNGIETRQPLSTATALSNPAPQSRVVDSTDKGHEHPQRITISPDTVAALRRPLPPEAIKPHPTKPYLSSIKTIYMIERLNDVFGLNGWQVRNEVVESNDMVVVKSTLTVPEYGIHIEQFGGNDNLDRGDAYKGACTDALSKIASYLYIGMDVYKGVKSQPPAPRKPVEAEAVLEKPWRTFGQMKECFKMLRERVGEAVFFAELKNSGVTDVSEFGRSPALRAKAIQCYNRLMAIEKQDVAS